MTRWILLVDDEPDLETLIRQRFRKRIQEGGIEFRFATNGRDALSILEAHPEIELVMTDIRMPVMDGLSLLQKLDDLEGPRRVAVILSAYGDMPNIRAAMNLGAFDFLNKPIGMTDLELTMDRALRQVERERSARENADRLVSLEGELAAAARIQKFMLPSTFPAFPERGDMDVYAKMLPAQQVGGDFYDYYFIAPDQFAFTVGDVSGKGIPAALYMSLCRVLLKASARIGRTPHDILRVANETLITELDDRTFITAFVGILDLPSGRVRYSRAGHNPPAHVRESGEVTFLEDGGGFFLGKFADAVFESAEVILRPGDTLFMFTDGITEAEDASGQPFDEPGLREILCESSAMAVSDMVRSVFSRVEAFTAGARPSDDRTALAVRLNPSCVA